MDPDGVYAGPKAAAHKQRIQKVFQGYMEAGYTKEDVDKLIISIKKTIEVFK